MDPTLGVILAGGLSALAAVLASLLTSRSATRASRDTNMLRWAEQMRANEQAARQEAAESRERADRIKEEAEADVEQLRADMDSLTAELRTAQALAAQLTDTLTMVAAEVWRPEPDIQALRRVLGRPRTPGVNGQPI